MAGRLNDTTRIAKPTARPLRVYAFDPSAGRYVGNEMVVDVRFEELTPGPVGERFAVIDYDASEKVYYEAVDLNDPHIIMRRGLDPSESDPRFHQQMVYAVASETLQRFEVALGRRVHWAKFEQGNNNLSKSDIRRAKIENVLCLFPHAMADGNAFYSRDAQGILFGYFPASRTNPGNNLPGQLVFTCLSHDIIAHETTHAILDGIRSYFTEPTNIDVAAFHEAFADLSALFCHFAHREVLLDTLQRTGGRLYDVMLPSEVSPDSGKPLLQAQIAQVNPLAQLAIQFGDASGMNQGLRQMLGVPADPNAIKIMVEPHDRGAILVAAVFDAYFTTYTRRTADLFRIYRAGGSGQNPVDLPQSLADRLASEAVSTAEEFFTICARAIDYCPPVDITFGDFLRALLTAHTDLHPIDSDSVRSALMEAFRLRGIVPNDASSFSEESICWPQVKHGSLPAVVGLMFGDPNGLTKAEKDTNGKLLRDYAKANAKQLGFPEGHAPIAAPSFHPMFRIGPQGNLIIDMVVELVETRFETDPYIGQYPVRGGVTLLIWQNFQQNGERLAPEVHYVIPKHFSAQRQQRQQNQFAVMARTGRHDESTPNMKGASREEIESAWKIDFGLVHAGL